MAGPDTDPAEIQPTYRPVHVYADGAWRDGTVLAWHCDRRGWRCFLDFSGADTDHYLLWVRYEPALIRPVDTPVGTTDT